MPSNGRKRSSKVTQIAPKGYQIDAKTCQHLPKWCPRTKVRIWDGFCIDFGDHCVTIFGYNSNEILKQTFIDIPFLEKPYIQYKGKKYTVNQHSKLVRRIFSKGSFGKGCRYYGGWWQSIGEKQREKILMDDRETIEIDYKSLHPVLAYAKKGIDFWKGTNTTKYLSLIHISEPTRP